MKILISFLLCVWLAVPMHAQLLLGRMSGTVTDASGRVVPGAQVEAVQTATNLKLTATTQDNGIYQFANLPIGTYKITVTQPGFQSGLFTSIPVSANRTTTVDAELALASVNAAVIVSAEAPLVNQSDATIGYVLDASTIQNTPLGTGSFTQLAILSPGVNAEFLAGSGTNSGLGNQNIWANGQRDTSNSFTVNAVSGNNLFNGKSSSQVAENRFLLNTGQNSLQHAGGDTQTSTSVYDAIGQGMPTPAPETLEELRVNTTQYRARNGRHVAFVDTAGELESQSADLSSD